MKLLIVLGIQEYRDELCELLRTTGINVFSEVDIKGYKNEPVVSDPMNWFAGSADPDYSVMFMAFIDAPELNNTMKKILELNERDQERKPVHAFQMPVERFI